MHPRAPVPCDVSNILRARVFELRGLDALDLIVPIYMKHYDRETFIAAIRFYGSAPGQRIIKMLPAVTAESMEAGKAWGAELARKTLKDLSSDAP